MNRSASLSIFALALVASAAHAATIGYSNIPAVLNPNYPSLGYQATSTSEFGDRITFGGTERKLSTVTLTMSSWAHSEDYGFATSYAHNLTLNVYDAGAGNTPGALLATKTASFNILYRPVGYTNNGIAFNVTFDMSSLNVTLPNSVVYGLAFNTANYGANPLGVSGPYNSLNFALNDAAGGGITAGSNNDLDDAFWNTSHAPFYTDGGLGGVGTFRRDTNWTPYVPMARFDLVPTPGSLALLGLGGLAATRRRRA